MAVDLSRVKERDSLPCRREPHWQRIRPGCFVGYRPSLREGEGNWIARAYDDTERRYRSRTLGDYGGIAKSEKFSEARKQAEAFAAEVEAGGVREEKIETVGDACRVYAKSKPDAAGRFKRIVYPDIIARLKLAKLRRHHLRDWRERLESKPALVTRGKSGPQRTRKRAPSSVNRDMVVLRAALNRVLAHGAPGTEAAWQEPLKAIRNADRQRTLYLDRDQRRSLLKHIDAEAEPFVRVLCLLPLRPGAVAALTVRDFDKRTSELTIGKDKSGKPRRILLPVGVAALFAKQARHKSQDAALLPRANGLRWDRNTWKIPIATAVLSAKLPAGATAYTLRHSTITDLVNGGLPLLTVAQISDTSAEMIERHYGHLCRSAASEALAGLEL